MSRRELAPKVPELLRRGWRCWGVRRAGGLGAAALLAAGCGRAPTPSGPAALQVVVQVPHGDTAVRSSVDVVFDRPVVGLGARDPSLREGRAILVLEPQPPGTYHWVGTRTLSYIVAGGLPPATSYRARLRAGLRAVDGSRLPRDVEWEFTTPRPQLVTTLPAPGDSLVRPEDPIVLRFNVGVDPQVVAQAARLDGVQRWTAARPDSGLMQQLEARFWGAPPEQLVVLRPQPALELDRAYGLRLATSLRALRGPLGPQADLEVPFRTYGPPALVTAQAGGGATLQLRFRTPMDPDSVQAYLALEPAVSRLQVWGYRREMYVSGALAYSTPYTLTLRRGMPDLFGQRLAEPVTRQVTTGHREPMLRLLPEDATLLRDAPRQVVLHYGNVGPVRLRARRIGAVHELQASRRNEVAAEPWALERSFGSEAERARDPNRLVVESVDLGPLLRGGPGAVVVEASARVPAPEGGTRDWSARTILRWSDVGVSVKAAPPNGLAWVTSLASGRPVAGAGLRIVDLDGRVRWRGTSDAQGMARLPGYRDLGGEPWTFGILAAVRGDTAASLLDGDWRVSPWRFGIDGAYDIEPLEARAFLYTDRDLYRSGETVHVAGLVRRLAASGIEPAGLDSVRLVVSDPLARPFATRGLAVDRYGGFAADLPLPAAPVLGRWTLEARVPVPPAPAAPARGAAETHPIGSRSIEVAGFRAPAFRTRVRIAPRHLLPGETLAGRVEGSYFFGAPLAGAPLRWSLVRQRAGFRPPGFAAFQFGDADLEISAAGTLAAGAAALDDSGHAGLRTVLPAEPLGVTQIVTLEATVQDPSGDAVSGRESVFLHPAAVYAGIAVLPRFVAARDTLWVRLVAVRADTALAAPGTGLELEVVRREWRSVRKLLVGGRVGFETTRVDTLVETRRAVAGSEPVRLAIVPAEPGGYLLRVRATDAGGRTQVTTDGFWVAGARATAWRPQETPQLEITTDRPVYAPGDVARLLVTSPLRAGRAVLTVEREGILEQRQVELHEGSQVFEVAVQESWAPNVYAGVAIVEPALSARQAPDLPPAARLPRYAVGYATLPIDVAARRLAVEVRPERREYRPGDEARLEVTVRDAAGRGVPARLGIAAVDEAVLALLGTPVPDPFAFFYQPRQLAVRNNDTRLGLSAGARAEADELKAAAGGDGGDGGDYRSQFLTTAYWNPDVETDAQGRAQVAFRLPDNLTRFRIAAVAASQVDRFGSGSEAIQVTQPLVLQAALPRFVLVGDSLQVAALVTNRTARPLAGRVHLEAGLVLRAGRDVQVEVPPGATRRVAFDAVAAVAGEQPVRLRADFPEAADAVQVTLPVEAPRLARRAATAGFTLATTTETVALPEPALAGSGRLALTLASSALAGSQAAIDYVVEYRYACLEQLSSRLLVLALARDTGLAPPTPELAERIDGLVRQIEALALPEGGFRFWPSGAAAEPWLAAYASLALGRAQRAGAVVSEDILQASGWTLARWWREWLWSGGERARSGAPPALQPLGIGLFAASERVRPEPGSFVEPGDLEYVLDQAPNLPGDERIFLGLALHNWGLRADLVGSILDASLQRADLGAAGAVVPAFETGLVSEPFRTATRATALTLLLAARVRPGEARVPRLATGLLGLRRRGHWGSTQDDALALLALAEYRSAFERSGAVRASVRAEDLGRVLLELEAPAGALEQRTARFDMPLPGSAARHTALAIRGTGASPAFYSARLDWDEPGLAQPPADGGYTLVRHVAPLDAPAAGGRGRAPAAGLGDLVVVTLQVVVPRPSFYLAIHDPLPGGLEIVQPHFEVESRQAGAALARWGGAYEPLPVSHVERDDRELRVFADVVPAGVYEHRYVARVRAAGGFGRLPAVVEAMYAPELWGSSGSGRWRAGGPR